MKKVVIVTNIPSPYRVDLFHYMQTHSDHYEIHVIYTSRSEDNRQWSVAQEKLINAHFLESRTLKVKGKLDSRYIHFPGNIGKILSQIDPAAIVAMEYNPAALQCAAWCGKHGRKFIHWTDGTLHSERNINFVQKLTRRIICANADACIASSTKAKEKLLTWGMDEKKIFTSLLTVDISRYQQAERAPVPGRILYVGSMIKRKGLDLLLEALKYVKCDFELQIVGNGTEEEIAGLKKFAQESGMDKKLTFRGFLQGKALVEAYQQAEVFVLPTREDCFGLVLLEAMCMGIPIISSKFADGAYDVILEGENGLLADPFDARAFAEAIESVIAGEVELAGSAQEHIDRFRFEQVSGGYIGAIDYALSTRKGQ